MLQPSKKRHDIWLGSFCIVLQTKQDKLKKDNALPWLFKLMEE